MLQRSLKPSCLARFVTRRVVSLASSAVMVLGLCSCQTIEPSDVTGSLAERAERSVAADPRRDVDLSRERFRANPKNADAALQYGSALRASGQRSQAVAVLEQAAIANPNNNTLLAGYGRALADNGNFEQAFDVLSRSHSPDDPDWRILSAQGAVLDELDRHDEARQYYASALKIAPEEASVLSNLGLSYILSNDLPKAEETLRRAHGKADQDARIRTNLAMAVGLQGRLSEAEGIVKAGLPEDQAAANVAYLRRLLSRKENAGRLTAKIAGRAD
jgi:Flp pilus assembly protein TadD